VRFIGVRLNFTPMVKVTGQDQIGQSIDSVRSYLHIMTTMSLAWRSGLNSTKTYHFFTLEDEQWIIFNCTLLQKKSLMHCGPNSTHAHQLGLLKTAFFSWAGLSAPVREQQPTERMNTISLLIRNYSKFYADVN
jgi:hypothetical protein